jgi:hypothetical protein
MAGNKIFLLDYSPGYLEASTLAFDHSRFETHGTSDGQAIELWLTTESVSRAESPHIRLNCSTQFVVREMCDMTRFPL